jgi:sterol desaturase/sphingolipid hydroxylase (fatty acid hydroxylase superfamily)
LSLDPHFVHGQGIGQKGKDLFVVGRFALVRKKKFIEVLIDTAIGYNPVFVLSLEIFLVFEPELFKIFGLVEILSSVFSHDQVDVVCPRKAILNKEVHDVHKRQ